MFRREVMRFKFNEQKATQVASMFLKKHGGTMNYMKLIKLMYLADREALSRWGRPLTGDSYVSMRHGPVLSEVLDKINHGREPHVHSYWHEYIAVHGAYSVRLKGEGPALDELSKRERGAIRDINRKFGRMDRWDLVDLLHKVLPEWKDPGDTSTPIHVRDIFKALNKTELEIEKIEGELSSLQFVKGVLSVN
jgi:uncharacterized phage-associated protein